MNQIAKLLETPKFERWLENKGDEVVGEVRSLTKCPVSNYLREHGFETRVFVPVIFCPNTFLCEETPTPAVIEHFISFLDQYGERIPDSANMRVTGNEALKFLQRAIHVQNR